MFKKGKDETQLQNTNRFLYFILYSNVFLFVPLLLPWFAQERTSLLPPALTSRGINIIQLEGILCEDFRSSSPLEARRQCNKNELRLAWPLIENGVVFIYLSICLYECLTFYLSLSFTLHLFLSFPSFIYSILLSSFPPYLSACLVCLSFVCLLVSICLYVSLTHTYSHTLTLSHSLSLALSSSVFPNLLLSLIPFVFLHSPLPLMCFFFLFLLSFSLFPLSLSVLLCLFPSHFSYLPPSSPFLPFLLSPYLRTYVHSYLPTYQLTYLPTYIPPNFPSSFATPSLPPSLPFPFSPLPLPLFEPRDLA